MDAASELKIELKRLKRHVNYLEKRFDSSVARDLSVTLRNLAQMSQSIDKLAEHKSLSLVFTHEIKSKAIKRIRRESEAFPLPAGAASPHIVVAGATIFNHAVSAEEMKQLHAAGPPSLSRAKMTMTQWLGASAYEFKTGATFKSVPRNEFIDRCANRLGGAHPMSISNIEKEHWADKYILELLNTQINLWPAPYAILMESAQELLRVLEPLT